MMTEHKTQGQQFLEQLEIAKDTKDALITLAQNTIRQSSPYGEKADIKEAVNRLTQNESIASLRAASAQLKIRQGTVLFADDYIYLAAKTYKDMGFGSFDNFTHDLIAHKLPQQAQHAPLTYQAVETR